VSAFDFVSNGWRVVEPWASTVRRLPRSPAGFAASYGTFADAADADRTVSALIAAAEAADRFGSVADVKAAIAADGTYLTSPAPPDMLVGRLMWWVLQVQNTATLVEASLGSLATVLASGSATPGDVRSVLTDESAGVTAALERTAAAGRDVASQLGHLRDRLLPQIETFAGTKMVSAANQALSKLNAQLTDLREQAAQDYQVFKHEALAPGDPPPLDPNDDDSSSWWPLGKNKQRRARADYSRVVDEMAALRQSAAPTAKFVADVRGLDVAGVQVVPAIGGIAAGVGKIVDTLDGLATRCHSVAASASDDQLTDHNWLTTALAAQPTIALGTDAHDWINHALVDTQPPTTTPASP
jgi:hypothetical protein